MGSRDFLAISSLSDRIVDSISQVIVGKQEQVELLVMALIAGGHVLLEDPPGTGKTSLAVALARSVDCRFNRIQFTPDIMPSDVTGYSLYNPKTNEFEFKPGAVMGNIILADEINRAPAKTQAALLEVMEESQVSLDGKVYHMDEPFMVLATQNPLEQQGTYNLPEAQRDRFLIRLSLGYPSVNEEVDVITNAQAAKRTLSPVVSGKDVRTLKEASQDVFLSEAVVRYIVSLVGATRNSSDFSTGASTRASLALANLARANAVMRGRSFVLPDDAKYLAPFVLGHRVTLSQQARSSGRTAEQAIASLIHHTATPALSPITIGRRHVRR